MELLTHGGRKALLSLLSRSQRCLREEIQVGLTAEQELELLKQIEAKRKPEEPRVSLLKLFVESVQSTDFERLKWWLKPKPKSRRIFFLTLEKMFDSGIPLMEALENCSSEDEDPYFHQIAQDIAQKVSEGVSLSSALRNYPTVFSELQWRTVEVGEDTGKLALVLRRLGEEDEKREQLVRRVFSQITYPLIVLAMAVPMAILVGGVILKPIQDVLSGLGESLPLIGRLFIQVFDASVHPLGILTIIASLVALFWMLKCGIFFTEDRFVKFLLRIPYIKNALHDAYALKLLEALLLQIQAGITLDKAIEMSFKASGHPYWVGSGEHAGDWIRQGHDAEPALDWLFDFPKPVPTMFHYAVENGTVESTLKQALFLLEANMDYSVDQMTAALQPMLMLILGFLAGGIILMVMMPLMRIIEVVM